jgi:hypothetical protein
VTICHRGMANLQVTCLSPPTRPSPTASRKTTRWWQCRFRGGAEFGGFLGSTVGVRNDTPSAGQLPLSDGRLKIQSGRSILRGSNGRFPGRSSHTGNSATDCFSANPAVSLMRGIGLDPVAYLPFSLARP